MIDQAAMLELSEAGKIRSARLCFAIDAYGPFDEERTVSRPGDEPIIRLYRSGISQDQYNQGINRRARLHASQKLTGRQDNT